MDGSLGKKQSPGPIIPEEVAAELDAVATDARTERRTEVGQAGNKGQSRHARTLLGPAADRRPRPHRTAHWLEGDDYATRVYQSQETPHALERGQYIGLKHFPAAGFVGIGRRVTVTEEYISVRCFLCDAMDTGTRHARISPKTETQVNQDQPGFHTICRTLQSS